VRIAYAKLGRSWQLDASKASTVGGDIDVIRLLKFMANKYPEHEFVLLGRNTGQNPQSVGYPPNVVNPWTEWKEKWWMPTDPKEADKVIDNFRSISGDLHKEIDAVIIWAGQHGSANSMIPMIKTDWVQHPPFSQDRNSPITGGIGVALATPQFAFMNYCSWLLDFISRWREVDIENPFREEIWLVPDPRNYLKCRELRWPLRKPVLAQFNMKKTSKHERYGDFNMHDFKGKKEHTVWVGQDDYIYSGLELTALPSPGDIHCREFPGENSFGMVINENRKGVKNQRLDVLKEWVLPHFPDCPLFGKWTDESQIEMDRKIEPVEHQHLYDTLRSFRSTFTTPASGSGWATSKPWECFATGAVCFFHPDYDIQGHIIPRNSYQAGGRPERVKRLTEFLRVSNPGQLKERVERVQNDDGLWKEITTLQRIHFEEAWKKWHGGAAMIEARLGLMKEVSYHEEGKV
jgi:hypothetical protein